MQLPVKHLVMPINNIVAFQCKEKKQRDSKKTPDPSLL